MASILPVAFVFIVVAGLMTSSALFVPKGPNQVVIRTTLMISLAACYLLWAVTYLAQLHPLAVPIHSKPLEH